MQIHVLAPGDEALLATVAVLFNEVSLSAADAAARLSDPSFVMVAAIADNGDVMGRVYGHVLNRLDVRDLFLYEVDVSDEYQRQGAGSAMLETAKRLCTERGYAEMFVLTEVSNEAGNGLYAAAGGVTEGSPANVYVFPTSGR